MECYNPHPRNGWMSLLALATVTISRSLKHYACKHIFYQTTWYSSTYLLIQLSLVWHEKLILVQQFDQQSSPSIQSINPVQQSSPVQSIQSSNPVQQSSSSIHCSNPVQQSSPGIQSINPVQQSCPAIQSSNPVKQSSPAIQSSNPVQQSSSVIRYDPGCLSSCIVDRHCLWQPQCKQLWLCGACMISN